MRARRANDLESAGRHHDLLRKSMYCRGAGHATTTMSTLLVSSKGQIVLPAATRRRLGLGAGSRLEVLKEPDGVRLRVLRSVPSADVAALAGMVTAPSAGALRRLQDFDPASLVAKPVSQSKVRK
jgi:antitoxin PrlF